MKISELIPSTYLKQSDVPEDKLVTVRELKKQNVARDDEDPEYKYIIFFEEFDKGMVLNSTNIKRLGKALGDDTEDWAGGKVVLYVDADVEYAGQTVGGLRIRAKKGPAAPARQSAQGIDKDDIPF